VARRGAPTCQLTEDIERVRERVRASSWDTCVVVNDRNVVLGRIGHEALERAQGTVVEEVMEEGPSTFRPDRPLEQLAERMRKQRLRTVLSTDSDGRLIGVLEREGATQRLGRSPSGAAKGGSR
jgi:Mg/Co/Ni transporter MgtE